MKKPLIYYMQKEKRDEFFTPYEAITPLLPYLPKQWIYWECTDFGNSNITNLLKKNGYKVKATGLKMDGFDFLRDEPNFEFDCIITNPPYSLKDRFLEKCYQYGKPFALLLPITALEGVRRGKLFRKYGIQLLVLDRRFNFMRNKEGGAWFNTSWFCWKILPKDLIFAEVKSD